MARMWADRRKVLASRCLFEWRWAALQEKGERERQWAGGDLDERGRFVTKGRLVTTGKTNSKDLGLIWSLSISPSLSVCPQL